LDYDCSGDIDHGVLAIGYGEENGIKYWLVKNSWGPNWGEGGYFKLKRSDTNDEGMCSILTAASFPNL
jgi:KDEL-tailed cysteine endopeptidase